MRIGGVAVGEAFARAVELPRADGAVWVLALRPLPLGFHRRLRERGVVPPVPPTRVARDSGGKVIRDERGLGTLVADEFDRGYRDELELYHQRVAVLTVAEALRGDPQVEFETPRSEDWVRYADELHVELERSGWTAGDLIRLCQEVCRLSNLVDEHVREAGAHFLPLPVGAGP